MTDTQDAATRFLEQMRRLVLRAADTELQQMEREIMQKENQILQMDEQIERERNLRMQAERKLRDMSFEIARLRTLDLDQNAE